MHKKSRDEVVIYTHKNAWPTLFKLWRVARGEHKNVDGPVRRAAAVDARDVSAKVFRNVAEIYFVRAMNCR